MKKIWKWKLTITFVTGMSLETEVKAESIKKAITYIISVKSLSFLPASLIALIISFLIPILSLPPYRDWETDRKSVV